MGYDNPRKLGDRETGGGLSLPVWITFMENALKGVPVMEPTAPEGVVNVGGEWYYDEYVRGAGVSSLGLADPAVPAEELNPTQHYLGNRARKRGVVEKCTFCIQRTREGRLPACAEACPTGARVFGNLLDPSSEIRWVLENKQVFRLKEELGTEPRFWYFMD